MTPDEQLDTVLRSLDHDLQVRETFTDIEERLKKSNFDIGVKNLDLLLDKLAIDGHIEKEHVISGGVKVNRFTYNISFQGCLFLSRGGYVSQSRQIKNNIRLTTWTRIANAANAIIIVGIAAFAAWTSFSQSQQEDKNKHDIITITNRLDLQAATIDSLKYLRTTTKLDTTK